jgi:hypothetical protein
MAGWSRASCSLSSADVPRIGGGGDDMKDDDYRRPRPPPSVLVSFVDQVLDLQAAELHSLAQLHDVCHRLSRCLARCNGRRGTGLSLGETFQSTFNHLFRRTIGTARICSFSNASLGGVRWIVALISATYANIRGLSQRGKARHSSAVVTCRCSFGHVRGPSGHASSKSGAWRNGRQSEEPHSESQNCVLGQPPNPRLRNVHFLLHSPPVVSFGPGLSDL